MCPVVLHVYMFDMCDIFMKRYDYDIFIWIWHVNETIWLWSVMYMIWYMLWYDAFDDMFLYMIYTLWYDMCMIWIDTFKYMISLWYDICATWMIYDMIDKQMVNWNYVPPRYTARDYDK